MSKPCDYYSSVSVSYVTQLTELSNVLYTSAVLSFLLLQFPALYCALCTVLNVVCSSYSHYLCIPWFYCCSPPQSGTRSHLAFVTLPLPILSVSFLKLTASSRPSALPSGSPKCLRFGHWLTLCTINIYLLNYLLTKSDYPRVLS